MTSKEKIDQLRAEIRSTLTPLIDRPFRLLEIPDYANPGDVLIFEGEMAFFKDIAFPCREMSTMSSFLSRRPRIPEDDLLVFSGGGYFGDLWPRGPDFQKTILKRYPTNPVLILPQSVCFLDKNNEAQAIEQYGKRNNLTICLRDKRSFDFAQSRFPNKTVLAPDMAFYASLPAFAESNLQGDPSRILLLDRQDAERSESPTLAKMRLLPEVESADWMVFTHPTNAQRIMKTLRRHPRRFGKLIDWHAKHGFRKAIVQNAIRQIAPFGIVVTTRLHGAVYGLLAGKKVVLLDNSYGKNRALFETWLTDCESMSMT